MDITITTIFYNGQFWIALVERLTDGGKRFIARYVFGPEPSNGDLLTFYLYHYERLVFHESDEVVRINKNGISNRRPDKALTEYKRLQKKDLERKKKEMNARGREKETEEFLKRVEKRKRKKRGR